MEVLVTYDVATDTSSGRRRLRHVAKICEAYGQRVQKSVFECILNETDLVMLVHRLAAEIDNQEDTLRIYRLREPRDKYLQVLGKILVHDLHDPLII